MAARKGGGDPRTSLPEEALEDIRPVVALPRAGLPGWLLLVVLVIFAVLLFAILDARRRAVTEPSVRPGSRGTLVTQAPPPSLVIPPAPAPSAALQNPMPAPAPPQAPAPAAPAPQVIYVPQPAPQPPPPEMVPPPRISGEPALVHDTSAPRGQGGATQSGGDAEVAGPASSAPAGTAIAGTRTRAGVLANRSTTVPQGTLIPAVLETALDSTRPGLARAIVSRDVRGFDGSRILIPRGSRLIGEYRSDAQPGQKRALVNWFRLIRPDGATIAIGSPAGDPLGRGGIRAQVNSHFFERFAGAILQSALDIGISLAAAHAGADAVVVLPGGPQTEARQVVQPQQVTPTLTVRQGSSISIFVARDLDFTGVEGGR